MKISEITRRDILDELRLKNINWHGRLDEVEFVSRLYPLDIMPSEDSRFPDMGSDLYQHRINNTDWDDWWVFTDSRLDLNDDKKFLDFLCEMIHPVVRSDDAEVATLLELFNRRLVHDGWKIIEKEKISGHPVFVAISNDAAVQVQDTERIGSPYALSQLKKCENKIGQGDYDGAISSSRSLLESVFADIFNKTTGETIQKGGSLMDSYKVIKNLLNLSDDKFSNESIKGLLRSLASMVECLDSLSNEMGDRHIRPVEPQRHHAQLCVNAAKTLTNFLYDTLEYRFAGKENVYQQLIGVLDSDIRNLSYDEMIKHKDVQKVYRRTDVNIRNLLKKKFIVEYDVDSYRDSDIFFSALEILRDTLTPADVRNVYEAKWNNNQACGLKNFIQELDKFNPKLVGDDMRELFKEKVKK